MMNNYIFIFDIIEYLKNNILELNKFFRIELEELDSNDKIIKAETGSFCYKSGECVDKIDFQDFNYDIISSYYENKLSIENLDGTIKSVELFDYQTKKYIDMTIKYTNDYIITPKVNGIYIFKINADYEGKDISYYFMSEIRKNK